MEREKERKEKRSSWRFFFPGPEARHALLAVLGGIFPAVRCN
jgi:hypothetical protein